MPMPANMNTATAPPMSRPLMLFLGAASCGSSRGASRSTKVGKRLRFLSPFGGAERSLPPTMERLAMLAVGDAISVPSELVMGEGGIGTEGSGGDLSSKILPKSTGEEEVAFVHGTADGAS